jgi:antitoxin MazE
VLTKKITKHGNSWAVVIDKPVLEMLKIDPTTPLEIVTDGQNIIIKPQASAERRKQQFEEALAETNRLYGGVLERLAQ